MTDTEASPTFWRKCTTCKKPIGFGQKYWICSVSTCNRIRTDLVFCDLRCFDAHVPVMNHRDAGAFEKKAPLTAAPKVEKPVTPSFQSAVHKEEKRQIVPGRTELTSAKAAGVPSADSQDILIVVSKLKAYIRSRSGMNTSDFVASLLTGRVKILADRAIESAKKSGRQTVLDRDI